MKKKIEEPLNDLEKDMNQLEGNLGRSGKIMSNMLKAVDKIRFHDKELSDTKEQHKDSVTNRRNEGQTAGVDDGCVFSGTASGKSANVKVKVFLLLRFRQWHSSLHFFVTIVSLSFKSWILPAIYVLPRVVT